MDQTHTASVNPLVTENLEQENLSINIIWKAQIVVDFIGKF